MTVSADLLLSLQWIPPVVVVDTPCTLSAHLSLREPELAEAMFQDRKGGFEKPSDKMPQMVDVPELATLQTIKNSTGLQHPRTASVKRFVVGVNIVGMVESHYITSESMSGSFP